MVDAAVITTNSYIFVHVPKTGGQSITAALVDGAKEVKKHAPLYAAERRGRFAFGFVRNPWARMVSLYRFHCQKMQIQGDNYSRYETIKMGFKAWALTDKFYMKEDSNRNVLPLQRRPQLWWLEGADFIGRFENIEEDFARIVALAGVVGPLPLGHINATRGGDWRDEYDEESLAFVAEHFAPDIERFGYKCE